MALFEVVLSNVAMAAVLAAVAVAVGRCCRRPALTHGLWLLVLVKLITPPLVSVPITLSRPFAPLSTAVAQPGWTKENEESQPPETKPEEKPLREIEPAVGDAGESSEPLPLPAPSVANANEAPRAAAVAGKLEEAAHTVGLVTEPVLDPKSSPLAAPAAKDQLLNQGQFPWFMVLAAVWVVGSAGWIMLAASRAGRFQRLLQHARPAAAAVQEEAQQLADKLRVRCPAVWLVPGVLAPMIWVMGRTPRLLLPENLLSRLSGEQRATLLAHELAHLRRGDPWIRYLELTVLALYWWCPLAWWARSELREAEEECCDAWVVWALPESARAYALALVETVEFLADSRPALPALASGFGHVQLLRRRLTMIMRGRTPRALTAPGALVVLGLGALLVPLLPSWAQAPFDAPLEKAKAKKGQEPKAIAQQDEADPPRKGIKKKQDFQTTIDKLQAMWEDLETQRRALEKQRRMLEEKARQLEQAMKELQLDRGKAATKKQPDLDQSKGGAGGFGRTPGPMKPGAGAPMKGPPSLTKAPDLQRRLGDLEKTLVLALRELQNLRRELGQPGQGMPGMMPGGPGGFGRFPPGGGGFPGGGQKAPGQPGQGIPGGGGQGGGPGGGPGQPGAPGGFPVPPGAPGGGGGGFPGTRPGGLPPPAQPPGQPTPGPGQA